MTENGDDEAKSRSGEAAAERLKAELETIRAVSGKSAAADKQCNAAVARNALGEELGWFGDYDGTKYDLSDAEKNILLAHARQDAAHAVANTSSIVDRLEKVERRIANVKWALNIVFIIGLISAITYWVK